MKKQINLLPAHNALILKQRESFPPAPLTMIQNPTHLLLIHVVHAAEVAVHRVINEMRFL